MVVDEQNVLQTRLRPLPTWLHSPRHGPAMRVLYWTDWFLPSIGGVEVFSARLLPALARRGHEITVVAGHHREGLPEETDFMGVTVRRFLFHPVLAAHDVERIGGLLGPSVLFHLETSRSKPSPVLLTMHSPVMEDATRPDTLYGRALRSARWVNCNSQAVRTDLCQLMPELRARSSVIYYGMEPPGLEPRPRPREEPVILGYGRLVPDKGFDLAIRAFQSVLHRFPRARLVLVGEGSERIALERLSRALGLAAAVEFTGAVRPENVPALLDAASLVVVPSRWDEPFGLVALEAALMARPVVATRAGGLVEVVEHDVTGLLVEKEDVVALAAAMVHLLTDPVTADRMGKTARLRARERFAWDRCVDEYEQLYESTLQGNTHG
jgi:glycogen(starch) synthase